MARPARVVQSVPARRLGLRAAPPLLGALLLVGIAILFALPGATARAESQDDERARAHFVAANAYFEDGRFNEAAREFAEAYQLSGRPEMLINLARAQERASAIREAIATLELLLHRHPQTSYKAEAEAQLARLRAQEPSEPEPASEPASEPAPGPSVVADVEPASPAPLDRKIWPPRWPTLAVGGGAAASVVLAIATGFAAHAKYKDLDGRCPEGACDDGYQADRDRGQRLARSSTAFTFAAVALGGVTAALWVLDIRRERARAQLGVRTSLTAHEANLRLSF